MSMEKIHFIYSKEADNTPIIQIDPGKETNIVIDATGRKKLVIGLGMKRGEMTNRKLILLVRQIVAMAKSNRFKTIEVSVEELVFKHLHIGDAELGELFAVNMEMANFEFVEFKTPPPEGWNFIEKIFIIGKANTAFKRGIEKGSLIGSEINASRRLANMPAGDMTPTTLAQEAERTVEGLPVKVTLLGLKEIRELNMGAILGVAKGSTEEPKFIVMEYRGGLKKDGPIVLVGKGVTFDSGGLNIKPSDHIYEMHMDMSGGAAVIHTIAAAARLKLKKNVIVLVPAVENKPSGSSYHPGDVLKTMSGPTIEVLNTDAEGRVILADALGYAKKFNPRLVVSVATLTGAAEVALGKRASAIFSKNERLVSKIQTLGEESGDYVWPLPMWSEYEEEIKGTFGDWANVGKTRVGGAIQGAVFLQQFAKDYPFVHIDMAPRMVSVDGEYLAKGSAGAPIRLLIKLIESF